jgi:hypothetical protein
MPAKIISEIDAKDRTRVGYKITGPSFAAVQLEIEKLQEAPHVARAHFQIPFNDGEGGPGEEYIAFGQTFARAPEFA